MEKLHWLALSLFMVTTSCDAREAAKLTNSEMANAPVGDEIRPCDGCPVFVRVPDAPSNLRAVKFVAVHELTWARYLSSVDEKKCSVPASFIEAWPDEVVRGRMIERYRVDWPAAYLSMREVDCYRGWIGEKTGLEVSLPTPTEWEWFASAGDRAAKFPWGQSDANPPAAVESVEANIGDLWPAGFDGFGDRELISGLRVGVFPPNAWGLFDLIGNNPEWTTRTVSGEEYIAKNPRWSGVKSWESYEWVLIKGYGRNFDHWRAGLAGENWTYLNNGRAGAAVSVRLVLIEGEA